MIRNFLAYELAVELHSKVESITKEKSLKHAMKDQLERAAQSVVLNLAEGSGKATIDLVDHLAACIYRLTYGR